MRALPLLHPLRRTQPPGRGGAAATSSEAPTQIARRAAPRFDVAALPPRPARTCAARRDFAASDLRTLRASLSAFMDMLALANRTLEAFA